MPKELLKGLQAACGSANPDYGERDSRFFSGYSASWRLMVFWHKNFWGDISFGCYFAEVPHHYVTRKIEAANYLKRIMHSKT
jgi:hypothetical protein